MGWKASLEQAQGWCGQWKNLYLHAPGQDVQADVGCVGAHSEGGERLWDGRGGADAYQALRCWRPLRAPDFADVKLKQKRAVDVRS